MLLNINLVLGKIKVDRFWEVRNQQAVSRAMSKIKLKNERDDRKTETEAREKAERVAKDRATG